MNFHLLVRCSLKRGPGSKSAEIYFSVLYARSTRLGVPASLSRSPGDGGRASFEQIAADNTKVVIRRMGESGPTIGLTECVYAGHVRLQTLVDLDEAAFVDFDPRVLEAELLDVRRAVRRHQQMRSAQRPLALAGF